MMTAESTLRDIPGGDALVEWFGRVPSFHDAELLEIVLSNEGVGRLRIYAWNMTSDVDAEGYFILDKHAIVILDLDGVGTVNCTDFDMMPGIIGNLEISKADERYRIEWDASYGVAGFITAKGVRISFVPEGPRTNEIQTKI